MCAQDNFSVASPLAELTKDEVREVSRELGLPNWNFAASPCLRSRLALNVEVGNPVYRLMHRDSELTCELLQRAPCLTLDNTCAIQATAKHLAAVESAEEIVRLQLGLTPEDNLRVRMVSTTRRSTPPSLRSRRYCPFSNRVILLSSLLDGELQSRLTVAGSSKRREFAGAHLHLRTM